MKSPAIDILIGAVTITAAIFLLNKYFTANKTQPTVEKELIMGTAQVEDQCMFPNEMLTEYENPQVDNWAQLSDRHFMSNHNFNSVPDEG